MSIKELCDKAYEDSRKNGFWEDWQEYTWSMTMDRESKELMIQNAISTRLMGVVGELAEAQEALRNGDEENFNEEIADAVIRIFSLSGALEINLEKVILAKMEKNRSRPYRHGKKF